MTLILSPDDERLELDSRSNCAMADLVLKVASPTIVDCLRLCAVSYSKMDPKPIVYQRGEKTFKS
jgi:hypothetical protein